MKCSKCGTEYEGLFCPECGTKAELSTSEQTENTIYNKCRNCGTEYEGAFCPECGTKAGEIQSEKTEYKSQIPDLSKKADQSVRLNKKTLPLIIVIILAVLVIAATAVIWIRNNNTADIGETAEQSTITDVSDMSGTQTTQSSQTDDSGTPASQTVQSTPAPTAYAQNQGSDTVNAGNSEKQKVSWNGSSEEYLKEYRLNSEQFTEEDILSLSQTELRMLLNGLYAYHGYTFTTDEYKRLFGRMSWYTPQDKTMEACESEFNTIERANKEVFIAHEKEMGWR